MTPEDNLEKFFENILTEDGRLSEEEWSIPSDALWESAKVHFPKKKKKDRAILFWFGLGIFGLLIGTGVASFMYQKANVAIVKLQPGNIIKKKPINDDNQTNQAIVTTSTEQIIAATKKVIHTKKSNKQAEINNRSKPKERIPKAKKIERKNKPIVTKIKTNKVAKSNTPWQIAPNKMKKEQVAMPTSLDKPIHAPKIVLLNKLESPIAFLNITERPLNFKNILQNLTIPVPPKFKQWEVGLSYAPFIIIQESILNNGQESSSDEIYIGVKHQNINFSIRRFIHPRFSVSSGLYLSKGGIDFAFCGKSIYEQNNPSTLRYFLKESGGANKIALANVEPDIDVSFEYSADANLKYGDVLTVKGGIPFKIKFVQMPVLFNTHFGKRKFKGFVQAGISLDYQQVKANDLIIDVFKGTELISEPVAVEPLKESSLKVRWQAGFGLRYAIKDFLQVGTGITINISDPILSRYDFGVYYGF